MQKVGQGDGNTYTVSVEALQAEIARLTAALADAVRAKECFQRMTRAHWEALCAMRNSINEYVPMPNTDSGPLFSPENGPIYADISERVIAALAEAEARGAAKTQAATDVLAERRRQISAEGWTPGHDDAHMFGEMATAASSYAAAAGVEAPLRDLIERGKSFPENWPWSKDWWKPTTRRRDLVKAGALILAEIERLDRALSQKEAGE